MQYTTRRIRRMCPAKERRSVPAFQGRLGEAATCDPVPDYQLGPTGSTKTRLPRRAWRVVIATGEALPETERLNVALSGLWIRCRCVA